MPHIRSLFPALPRGQIRCAVHQNVRATRAAAEKLRSQDFVIDGFLFGIGDKYLRRNLGPKI